jgi:hypothetical protein
MMQGIRGHCGKVATALLTLAVAACAQARTPAISSAEDPPLITTTPVRVQAPVPAWPAVDAATGRIADIAGLERLALLFPDSASVRLRLMNAHLQADATGEAVRDIRWLRERGYVLSPGAQAQLAAMLPPEQGDELRALFADAPVPLTSSSSFALVPANAALVESVLFDPANERLFATSIVSRSLFVRTGDAAWHTDSLPGAGSLGGIAIDEKRGLVWIASGVYEVTPEAETAFRGLIALDRQSLEERARIAAPDGVSLSDIAVGPDGRVYASDPEGGGVYVTGLEGDRLDTLVWPGVLRSPQGIVPHPGGHVVYVSDYRYGLASIQRSGVVTRVESDIPILLDGIDGMWWHDGNLIAVQNGINPMRIVALRIERNRVVEQRTIERASRAWTEPLGGSISDGKLVYVANGQWDRFGPGGAPVDGKPAVPTEIREIDLEASPSESPKNPG